MILSILRAMVGPRLPGGVATIGRRRSYYEPRLPRRRPARRPVALFRLLRVCPGGRHAWFESSAGIVRKPVQSA